MKYSFYISKERFYLMGLIQFFLLVFEQYYLFLLSLVALTIYLFLFRKKKLPTREGNSKVSGIINSPCNGLVVSKREGISHFEFGEDLVEVRMIIPHFYESGIYFPCPCETEEIKEYRPKEILRYQKSLKIDQRAEVYGGETVRFQTIDEEFIGMQLVKCFFSGSPEMWILQGDRGARGARMGYFPYGGNIFLYLPKNYEVLVKTGQKIIAGETILANRK